MKDKDNMGQSICERTRRRNHRQHCNPDPSSADAIDERATSLLPRFQLTIVDAPRCLAEAETSLLTFGSDRVAMMVCVEYDMKG